MAKQSVFRRIVTPILIVLVVMILSMNLHDLTRRIDHRTLHLAAACVTAGLMFLSIWLGAMFGNTLAFFRGAAFRERLFVSLFTPVVWGIKTWSSGLGIFSGPEMVYLAFHHLVLGAPVVNLIGMGLSEIWCRAGWRRKTGDRTLKIMAPANTLVLVLGVVLTTVMLWNGGHTYYYWYMDLYTRLF